MFNHAIYDIESYPNIFTFCIGDTANTNQIVYEISTRRNDFRLLLKALAILKTKGVMLVGYNNLEYDYPVVHDLLSNATHETPNMAGADLAYSIYLKSQSLFQQTEGFKSVRDNEVIIKQIDLFRIKHFNNKNRRTSLKCLEFKMRSPSIQDLPFTPGIDIPVERMDDLVEYNRKDVRETANFYNLIMDDITFREELSESLGVNVRNFDDTKIGAQFFISRLEAELGPETCYVRQGRGRKVRQTKRDEIVLRDIIDPRVQFKTPEFNAIKEWVMNQVISETKGVFNDIDLLNPSSETLLPHIDKVSSLMLEEKANKKEFNPGSTVKQISKKTQITLIETGEVLYTYSNNGSKKRIDDIRSKYPEGQLETQVISHICPKLCIPFANGSEQVSSPLGDLLIVYGLGGLHASIYNKHIKSDDEWVILDADVISYYPRTAVSVGAYPEHLSEYFVTVYKALIEERMQHAKGTSRNAALKLSLNAVYGKTNDSYSPFYDPQCTMKITLNGQMFLSMLIESLKLELGSDVDLIQANTDGITVRVKRDEARKIMGIFNSWCKLTGLQLEYAFYNHMFIKDVNNYMAVKQDGSVKTVGCYADPVPSASNPKGDWAKNHSELVVYKTAVKKLLNPHLNVLEELKAHDDVFDFMFYLKGGGANFLRLELTPGDEKEYSNLNSQVIQKRSRFVVTTSGYNLFKIYKETTGENERVIQEKKLFKVTLCNDVTTESLEQLKELIDYNYYVKEVNKLLNFEEI